MAAFCFPKKERIADITKKKRKVILPLSWNNTNKKKDNKAKNTIILSGLISNDFSNQARLHRINKMQARLCPGD